MQLWPIFPGLQPV